MRKLRAKSLQPPACPSKTTEDEAEAVLVASVACVMERTLEAFVLGKALGGGLWSLDSVKQGGGRK